MTILTDESLEFAREHIPANTTIQTFFRNPLSLTLYGIDGAMLRGTSLQEHCEALGNSPRAMAIAKPKIGFRVVHQLEPLDALVYTALACQVATAVEAARMPSIADRMFVQIRHRRRKLFCGRLGLVGLHRENRRTRDAVLADTW